MSDGPRRSRAHTCQTHEIDASLAAQQPAVPMESGHNALISVASMVQGTTTYPIASDERAKSRTMHVDDTIMIGNKPSVLLKLGGMFHRPNVLSPLEK